MTYIIAEPCIDIKDRSCVDVCPVDCIHEFERILVIDPEECIDCGACEPECPVEAIFPEDALPEKWSAFVPHQLRVRRGCRGRQPADERVRDRAQRPERAARVAANRLAPDRRIRLEDLWPTTSTSFPRSTRSTSSTPTSASATRSTSQTASAAGVSSARSARPRAGARLRRGGPGAAGGAALPHPRAGSRRAVERRSAAAAPLDRRVGCGDARRCGNGGRGCARHLVGVAPPLADERARCRAGARRPAREARSRYRERRERSSSHLPVRRRSPSTCRRRRRGRPTRRG